MHRVEWSLVAKWISRLVDPLCMLLSLFAYYSNFDHDFYPRSSMFEAIEKDRESIRFCRPGPILELVWAWTYIGA